jgi:hypothetical protein
VPRTTDLVGNPRIAVGRVDMGAYEMPPTVNVTFDANGGLFATGQTATNIVVFVGDLYGSWLSLSNEVSREGYTFSGWFTALSGCMPVLPSHSITSGWVFAQWAPARPTIPGNPNLTSNFLNNVTQSQVDALVAGLRAAHPDVTDGEIAKKFEDAELFNGAALVGLGDDTLVRLIPSISLAMLSVSEGDPKTLVVTVTIGNNIDSTPSAALARIGEAINVRMRGIFKDSLSSGESETTLTPVLSVDSLTGIVTATFTLETPSASSGFLRLSLRR